MRSQEPVVAAIFIQDAAAATASQEMERMAAALQAEAETKQAQDEAGQFKELASAPTSLTLAARSSMLVTRIMTASAPL